MIEVTIKVFGPAATETYSFFPLLIFCNVLFHITLRGTLRYFDPKHEKMTEGYMTHEVTAYVKAPRNNEKAKQSPKEKAHKRSRFWFPARQDLPSETLAAISMFSTGSSICPIPMLLHRGT